MKKREQGILTVEASIVLTFFTLFALFLFSFVRIYRAENMVSHATLQAADAVALESYLRETALDDQAEDVVYLASRLTGSETLSADSFKSLRFTDILPSIAKEKFVAAVSNSESNADKILTNLGVKDGLSGIDFSSSEMDLDHDDVIVSVSYTLKMQFPIFGANELSVTKSAKAKTFGEILFEITTKSNDEIMGSATGGGNYQHGKTIQITAIPNSGYRFVKWDDGDTSNPRTVTVTEAHTYIAVFEEAGYGVTVKTDPENGAYGTAHVSSGTTVVIPGGGTGYEKGSNITVSAYPNTGYHLDHWIITQNNTGRAERKEGTDVTFTVDQSYTCTAYFIPNEYHVTATSNINGANPKLRTNLTDGFVSEGNIKFGEKYFLATTYVPGYEFAGWYIEGETNRLSNDMISTNNPIFNFDHDVTFVAKYIEIPRFKITLNPNGGTCSTSGFTVLRGESSDTLPTPMREGFVFNGWKGNGTIYNSGARVENVTYDMTLEAQWINCSHNSESCSVLGKHQFFCRAIHGKVKVVCSICGTDCRPNGIKNSYRTKKCNVCGKLLYEEDASLNIHIAPSKCSTPENFIKKTSTVSFGKIKYTGITSDDFNSACDGNDNGHGHKTTYKGTCGDKGYKVHDWVYYYHIICDHCHAVEEPPRESDGYQQHWCGNEDSDHGSVNNKKKDNVNCENFSTK